MRRKILIGVLAGLAAICLALQVWSYWWHDVVGFSVGQGHGLFLVTLRGCFAVGFAETGKGHGFGWKFMHMPVDSMVPRGLSHGFAFDWGSGEKVAGVPLWLIAALLILIAWRIHRRRPTPPGLCIQCGYDLRATPEGGAYLLEVCPECGTARTAPALVQ